MKIWSKPTVKATIFQPNLGFFFELEELDFRAYAVMPRWSARAVCACSEYGLAIANASSSEEGDGG
eukprot:12740413-Prorocentrum_lima.AAC.1